MKDLSILIVDDDVWMQRILSKIVSSFGFRPYVASNGYDGISLAVEHLPSLILLDVMMADLSGHQTLKTLKAIRITKEIPIIMVTAISDIENIGGAIRAGAVGFIGKPFTRATIYDKIRDILGKEMLSQASSSIKQQPEEKVNDEHHDALTMDSPEADDSTKISHLSQQPQASHNAVSQHYREDDKRNLDAIKDLLLKPDQ